MSATLVSDQPLPMPVNAESAAEANHRIANSLTLLMSLVRMQAGSIARRPRPLSNAEVRLLLDGIAARINTIGQLHRLLSHMPQDGATDLQPHLRAVTGALVSALSAPEQPVRVLHTGSDCVVLIRHVQPIVLILCEVFINAMKYAHPAGVPLLVRVDCALERDGRLILTIGDDGVGLPDGFDPQKSAGLGLRVMRSLAAEIGATLDVMSSGLGLSFRLILPPGALANARLA